MPGKTLLSGSDRGVGEAAALSSHLGQVSQPRSAQALDPQTFTYESFQQSENATAGTG